MLQIKKSIKDLYRINLVEGEGVGTAYEYFVKLKKLERFIRSVEHPRKMVIFGLPERYGLSMDFFFLGQLLQTELSVVDDRAEVLKKAEEVFRTLVTKNIFQETKIEYINQKPSNKFDNHRMFPQKFDLALSSEVLQRFSGEKESYLSNIAEYAKSFAIFVPNQKNVAHGKISGLKGVELEVLLDRCREENPGLKIVDHGYLDLPPFPPGISRSEEKRAKAAEGRIESFLMKGLELYGRCENFMPQMIKKNKAHIVYFMGINR